MPSSTATLTTSLVLTNKTTPRLSSEPNPTTIQMYQTKLLLQSTNNSRSDQILTFNHTTLVEMTSPRNPNAINGTMATETSRMINGTATSSPKITQQKKNPVRRKSEIKILDSRP